MNLTNIIARKVLGATYANTVEYNHRLPHQNTILKNKRSRRDRFMANLNMQLL